MWVKEGVSENTSSVLRERKIYIECVYSKREREYIKSGNRKGERERERENTENGFAKNSPRHFFAENKFEKYCMTAKCKKISILLAALFFWIVSNQLWLGLSVTSKKLPNVYKSCPK